MTFPSNSRTRSLHYLLEESRSDIQSASSLKKEPDNDPSNTCPTFYLRNETNTHSYSYKKNSYQQKFLLKNSLLHSDSNSIPSENEDDYDIDTIQLNRETQYNSPENNIKIS